MTGMVPFCVLEYHQKKKNENDVYMVVSNRSSISSATIIRVTLAAVGVPLSGEGVGGWHGGNGFTCM